MTPTPSEPDDMLTRTIPLEDRIFEQFKNKKFFNASEVVDFFAGRENQHTVYRALRKLTADGRIKFEGYVDRKKVFTPRGTSDLPYIKNFNNESHPISFLLLNISGAFDESFNWNRAKSLNELIPLLSRLFVIAQFEDDKDQLAAFNKTINEINEIRTVLTWMLSLINDVYRHPSMKGNMPLFKRTFNGNDEAMPTPAQINEFKIWYKQFVEAHK